MNGEDLSKLSAWDLVLKIRSNSHEHCAEVDPILAEKITDQQSLCDVWYYLGSDQLPALMPLCKQKINQMLRQELSSETIMWWRIRDFLVWADEETEMVLINSWLTKDGGLPVYWMHNIVIKHAEKDIGIEMLEKIIKHYKKHKAGYVMNMIGDLFAKINTKNLDKGCELLASSTPAVAACLLKREDIPAQHVPTALKALGKLTGQRKITTKIDFSLLQKLGPRERLNTMQQLLGLFDGHYRAMMYYKKPDGSNANDYYAKQFQQRYEKYGVHNGLPFKEMPSKEEVEQFLFPCSLKFNKEVSDLMARYNELIALVGKSQGENNGECV